MKYAKITISGKICTGKSTLFRRLIDHLDWPSFSTSSYFRKLAKERKASLENAEEQNEKTTKEVDYHARDLIRDSTHIIVEGWMAGIMANRFPGVLKILLVSDDNVRIKRFSAREKTTAEKAGELIKARESNLFRTLGEIYGRHDFVDPKNYNLVIDSTSISADEVFDMVIRKLNGRGLS